MRIAFVGSKGELLSLEYLSGVLKSKNHEVKLFIDPMCEDDGYLRPNFWRGTFDSKKRIINALKEYNPGLVGMSVMSDIYPWAKEMGILIKKNLDVPIILGGIHPTCVPERVINKEFADMVCVGEGEYPLLELVDCLERGIIDYSIKNIWFKKDGQIIKNELRPLIEKLDALPFPDKEIYYSIMPHYSKQYYVITKRGCVNACNYCCNSYKKEIYRNKGEYLRFRSVANVIEELEEAKKKYKINFFRFQDDNFAVDINWLRSFCAEYKKKINLPFFCAMHPDCVSEESAAILKEAKCHEICLGVETLENEVNKQIFNRPGSLKQIENSIKILKKNNIRIRALCIYIEQFHNESYLVNFARFFNNLRTELIYISHLTYYPRTKITEWAYEKGFIKEEDYGKILEGDFHRTYIADPQTADPIFLKIKILLACIPFFPKKIIEWMITKRIYRLFPTFYCGKIATFGYYFFTKKEID